MIRYVLERRIGEGGMAEVFRAKAVRPGGFERLCAVKRLLPDLAKDPARQARFLDEGRIAARLHHPNVVAVLDFFEEEGRQHLVMEFVDGASVEHLVQRGLAGRFVTPAVAARVVLDVARALEHAHASNVLHRDVSCCNVLVSREGEVKLADFGLADADNRVSRTEPGALTGKLAYLSPERRAGQPASPADDVYALGVVLARLIEAMDPRVRATPAGQRLDALQRTLVAPRTTRPPSAPAVLEAMKDVEAASVDALRELVRNNPQPRGAAEPDRLRSDELEETTEGGEETTENTPAQRPTEPMLPAIVPDVKPPSPEQKRTEPLLRAIGSDRDKTTDTYTAIAAPTPAHAPSPAAPPSLRPWVIAALLVLALGFGAAVLKRRGGASETRADEHTSAHP